MMRNGPSTPEWAPADCGMIRMKMRGHVFAARHQDHLIVNAPEGERRREVADLLARIRLNTSE